MRHERTDLPLTLGGKVITSTKHLARGKPMRRREFITVIGAVAGLPLAARAQEAGQKPPTEIQTLIDNHINAFNTQNIELFHRVFGDTAIIIDGIAPYRWLNPNAPANWLADVEKWRKDLGVTHEHLSYKMGFWNVEGSDAYAVIAGALAVTIKGQTATRNGTLAYTFSKHGEEWKIDAQAWGRTS
jgi:ketosteroid isomerase-like protein